MRFSPHPGGGRNRDKATRATQRVDDKCVCVSGVRGFWCEITYEKHESTGKDGKCNGRCSGGKHDQQEVGVLPAKGRNRTPKRLTSRRMLECWACDAVLLQPANLASKRRERVQRGDVSGGDVFTFRKLGNYQSEQELLGNFKHYLQAASPYQRLC